VREIKNHKKCFTVCLLQLGLWRKDAQTKRMCHCPWFGDDAYALGWGVIKPQAMVGAKATPHHGCSENQK
jgi:hypothetical protein